MASKRKTKAGTLQIEGKPDETREAMMARVMLGPNSRHGLIASSFAGHGIKYGREPAPLTECAQLLGAIGDEAAAGNIAFASRLLAAQAMTLDTMFTELARRAAINMGEYINAAEKYARLALKAQSNSRATLDALAKLHQPREQTVRHVHVNDGGQAIVADHFHHHAGGVENAESIKQSHATGTAGQRTALPGQDAGGDCLPIASREGMEKMPDARRD